MTKKLLLATFFSLLVNIAFGQTQQKFTPQQMRQDIDSLVKNLLAVHPNPFYRYPKSSFFNDIDQLKAGLTTNLTKVEFYLWVETLLGHLEDGHTDLAFPSDYYDANPFVFPYNVKLSTQKPFIVLQSASTVIKSEIPAGAEIISVNNIPAQQIANDIADRNTGENRLFRADFGSSNFDFYLEALYKANGIYRVKYKDKGLVKTVAIQGLRKSELDKRHREEKTVSSINADPTYSIKLFTKDYTALIDFKSFDWDGFSKFMDTTFRQLKEKHIKHLIINLIDDGGGDSDVGDEFFQYLLDKPFTQYAKILEKNSEPLKQRLREHRKDKALSNDDKALLAKPDGSLDTVYCDKIAIRKNPWRYDGEVILLTNIKTYSSAADFAQCFKYYKRGLIIGEETGGLIKSYGDIVPVYLPNTGLELTISSKLYYNSGAGENDWHGVIPDIKATSDEALQRAFDYIDEQGK
ncbi:S41 family peptidase [Mucilaginibacter sp. dw_454]|uniref:S41 family peptidase n=1 Tax=Mucilaginibacter sp. dw_454 TaxID=2720079 RepID=UPI001BD3B7B6|nr:S41 family peptidase [Mucilaginibacter sp. dw_454]